MEAATPKTKVELRRQMCAMLAALTPDEVRARSILACRQVAAMHELLSAEWVMGFVSFGTEVHTHELLRTLLAEGRHVCVPSFDPVGQRYICSELRQFDEDLREGVFRILEPRRDVIRPVHAEKVNAWLVPGLAFDRHGNRLGRGIGYFDRLLVGARGVTIGVGYDFQLVREVPAEAHDVRLDFIVTETEIVTCKNKGTDQ
jgi:5-formyltetrahydrofolate cyclo-ligase